MIDKGKIVYFPDLAAIEAEAAAWVAHFDGGPLSAEEAVQFQEWVSRSPAHREAIIQFGELWSEFDQLRYLTDTAAVKHDAKAQTLRKNGTPRRWLVAGIAASFVGIMAVGAVYRESAVSPPEPLYYNTAVGEQKHIALSDGSTVVLNTNSRIAVEISKKRRDVHLIRGEAYFNVAHDEQRPFSVYANNGLVRDVGTAFNVRLLRGAVDVAVTSGTIEISSRDAKSDAVWEPATRLGTVKAGQTVVFGKTIKHMRQISDADMNRMLAWRQGMLIYAGDPLEKVAEDIGRYSGIEVEFADPKLRDRRIGGSVKIGQFNAVFESLQKNFGVRVEWRDSKHVRLSPS